MHAAVPITIPAAAPAVTQAASAPVYSAMISPALRCRSSRRTNCCDASDITATISGWRVDAPSAVIFPEQLITRFNPRSSYTPISRHFTYRECDEA
jgi:hypothetical protein